MKTAVNAGIERLNIIWLGAANRWRQLSYTEQWLTAIALVTLFIWLLWQSIVSPLSERQMLAEKKLATSRAQLSLVQQQAEQILRLKAAGATERSVSNAPMDQLVHQLAGRHRLIIQRVQNRGEILAIDLANVRFDQLMAWLATLEQQYQISVRSIQLDSTETSGVVEVRRLQLERG